MNLQEAALLLEKADKLVSLFEAKRVPTSDPEFMRVFKDCFLDGHYNLKDLPNFPEGLDLENCDVVYVADDYIQFKGGGDWQDPVSFSLAIIDGKPQIVGLYDSTPSRSHEKEINAYTVQVKQELGEVIQEKRQSQFAKLEKNKVKLTPEERKEVMDRGAVWHNGPGHSIVPAVWKSVDPKTGKATYVCNTHRAYQAKPTLKGAIGAFKFIKTTA